MHDDSFPPKPDRAHEYGVVLAAFESVLNTRRVDYVSAPITGGRLFCDWFDAEGRHIGDASKYAARHRSAVIAPNIAASRKFVEQLRTGGELVIDPAAFEAAQWTQSDYRFLWGLVIKGHIKRSFFLDGWEYANGCVYEFYICKCSGVAAIAEGGDAMSVAEGVALLRRSLKHKNAVGLPATFVADTIAALERIP